MAVRVTHPPNYSNKRKPHKSAPSHTAWWKLPVTLFARHKQAQTYPLPIELYLSSMHSSRWPCRGPRTAKRAWTSCSSIFCGAKFSTYWHAKHIQTRGEVEVAVAAMDHTLWRLCLLASLTVSAFSGENFVAPCVAICLDVCGASQSGDKPGRWMYFARAVVAKACALCPFGLTH